MVVGFVTAVTLVKSFSIILTNFPRTIFLCCPSLPIHWSTLLYKSSYVTSPTPAKFIFPGFTGFPIHWGVCFF